MSSGHQLGRRWQRARGAEFFVLSRRHTRNVCETKWCPSTVNRRVVPCSNSNLPSQPNVFNYVDGPTVTGYQNCYCVGNLFTDWSSYFPREVVKCGWATIYPGTAFCRVLCIKVIT